MGPRFPPELVFEATFAHKFCLLPPTTPPHDHLSFTAGNGCANFMGAWHFLVLLLENPHAHKILPFRGGFWTFLEGGVEVPFLFLWAWVFFSESSCLFEKESFHTSCFPVNRYFHIPVAFLAFSLVPSFSMATPADRRGEKNSYL